MGIEPKCRDQKHGCQNLDLDPTILRFYDPFAQNDPALSRIFAIVQDQ